MLTPLRSYLVLQGTHGTQRRIPLLFVITEAFTEVVELSLHSGLELLALLDNMLESLDFTGQLLILGAKFLVARLQANCMLQFSLTEIALSLAILSFAFACWFVHGRLPTRSWTSGHLNGFGDGTVAHRNRHGRVVGIGKRQ